MLLLDPSDRVLLLLSIDPDDRSPERRWWTLPGGGAEPGESLSDAARRELEEETGFSVGDLGEHVWDRESRFYFRHRWHHTRERVWLARVESSDPPRRPTYTANEQRNLIESRWWSAGEMRSSRERFIPANLPDVVTTILDGSARTPMFLDA